MKNNRIQRLLIVLVGSVFLLIAFGQGCGKFIATSGSGSEASSATAAGSMDVGGIKYSPKTLTVSLVYSKQILSHFSSCLGSGAPSDRTLAMFDKKKGAISDTGSVTTLTSPMLVASSSIVGELCKDLINAEAVRPRIFVGFNFTAASLPGQTVIKDSMRRIARSCWGRDEDPVESEIIVNSVNTAFSAGGANAAHDAALFMCTGMLSSLDALVL
jgi:hypothetical protein